MMDIDHPPFHHTTDVVRQNLHVAGQHHEFRASLFDKSHQAGFRLWLVVLGDLDLVKGDVVVNHRLLVGQVIGYDTDDIDGQSANAPAIEQVVQAVAEIRYHHQH